MKISVGVRGGKQVIRDLDKITNRVKLAAMQGINRVAQRTRTAVTREAAKDYVIKVGDVRKTIDIKKATRNGLMAKVISKGNNIELKKFKVTPMKVQHRGRKNKRLKAKVKKNGSYKMLESAFVAKLSKQPDINVYERVGRERHIVNKLFGPSVPQMIKNESVLNRISRTAEEWLDSEVNRQVARWISKGGK